ncbi:MAG: glycosyl transferase family 2 [Proteobacteria bacterium]|nr:MAG: glycosyl transferase family 2 [Pseudomonadota bacterium]
MKQPKVSIILVSYNTAAHTLRALETVYAETHSPLEVIVVDNQSSDNSVVQIRQHFPQVHLIESADNSGFAGGVCQGVAVAQGEYLLLLNPDTLILNQAIDHLLAFAEQYPENGIWGGVTLNNDHSLNTQHAWSKPDFLSLLFSAMGLSKAFNQSCFFNHANYGCWKRDSIKEVDIISGCFFLTTRYIWDQVGGLDPDFFMYAEEADFCLRARQYGYRPIVTPDARIVHHGGISHTRFSNKLIKLLKGKVELIERHVPSWKRPIYKFLLYFYVLNKHVSHLLLKPSSEQTREWQQVYAERSNWLKGYH